MATSKTNSRSHFLSGALGVFVIALCLAPLALSHIINVLAGVHFRGERVDFGSPPPKFAFGNGPFRSGTQYFAHYETWEDSKPLIAERQRKLDRELRRARECEKASRFHDAIAIYRRLNSSGLIDGFQAYRRVLVLRGAVRSPDARGIQWYLGVTASKAPLDQGPGRSGIAPFLRPFIAYEQASRLFDAANFESARSAYRSFYTSYPKSPLADSALVMAARCSLEGSDKPPSVAACETGKRDLETLREKFPNSRFGAGAIGLEGRIAYAKGDFVRAAQLYEVQMQRPGTRWTKSRCLDSLIRCWQNLKRPDLEGIAWLRRYQIAATADDVEFNSVNLRRLLSAMSATQASRFASRLKENADLMAAYIAIRLEMSETNSRERREMIRIASAALVHSRGVSRGRLLARLAQAKYENNDIDAGVFAESAVRYLRPPNESWALAQYLLGSVHRRGGRLRQAVRDYQLLLAKAPGSYLCDGARETLANLYDRMGNYAAALDQFYALGNPRPGWSDWFQDGYNADIAYLLDMKMSPAEIQAYIARHPRDRHRKVWIYSLGLRYLRENQYARAKRQFLRLSSATRVQFATRGEADHDDGLHPRDPLKTTQDLRKLSTGIRRARGAEARARASFELASYYYLRRDGLFYNMPLWQGNRAEAIDFSWNPDSATPRDEIVLRDHCFEHECLMRAYKECKLVLKLYPHTSIAPNAAYRAACSAERLSNFNEWWRWESARTGLMSEAIALMKQVQRDYPKSNLVKSAAKYEKDYGERLRGQDYWKNAPSSYRPSGWGD